MEMTEQEPSRSAQAWTKKAVGKHSQTLDYYSELRRWVQRAILRAEEKGDLNRKDQLLDLLREL